MNYESKQSLGNNESDRNVEHSIQLYKQVKFFNQYMRLNIVYKSIGKQITVGKMFQNTVQNTEDKTK